MLNIDVHTGREGRSYSEIGTDVLSPILAALEALPTESRKAIWQSIMRTMTTVRKELVKRIRDVSYLKSKRIKDSVGFVQMYGRATAYDHISGSITVSSKHLPIDAFKITPKRPTHPKGRKLRGNMKLSGYQIGPHEPVRYRPRNQERSAGFVVKNAKGLRFLVGIVGKYHRAPNGNLHQNLLRATAYSVQYFASFQDVHWPIQDKMKDIFIERLNHEVQYRLKKIGERR